MTESIIVCDNCKTRNRIHSDRSSDGVWKCQKCRHVLTRPDHRQELARVFVSYSRKDAAFALRLSDALESRGVDVFRDLDDIEPTEEWWPRIQELVRAADTVVYIITPDSVQSRFCAREIALCVEFNKRIAPVLHRETPDASIPAQLSKLNFVFFQSTDDFDHALDSLVAALRMDLHWIREHTRLFERALRWLNRGGALLAGDELAEAERWLSRHPTSAPRPTDAHRSFIAAGRKAVDTLTQTTTDMNLAQDYVQQGNMPGAIEAWKRAAAMGNAAAMREIGHLYYYGKGVPEDEALAAQWYQKAADNGDLQGLVSIAGACEFGEGVKQDNARAAALFRRAAELGSPLAMAKLGQLQLRGLGVPKDNVEGMRWLQAGIDLGFPIAMTEVADILLFHPELRGDRKKAFALLERAAAASEPKAIFILAQLYLEGEVVSRDLARGVDYMRRAADLGLRNAKFELGKMHIEGVGVPRDQAEGIRWLRIAAAERHEGATRLLSAVRQTDSGESPTQPQPGGCTMIFAALFAGVLLAAIAAALGFLGS